MSIEAELREEYERWERREISVVMGLPYVLLAVGTGITCLQWIWGAAVHLPAALGLTFAAVAWVFWFLTRHPGWHENGPLMGLYFTGLTVLAAGLVVIAPWYGIFAFVGYVQAVLVLKGGWRYAGIAATSMIMATVYLGGVDAVRDDGDWWLWAAISLISTALAATFIFFALTTEEHGRRQKQALAELHESNVRLEEALEENAALHARLMVQAREAGVLDERQRMA
ncbi:hypothetical protein ACFQ07_24770, partial [Actinomadura adrarensis]